MKDSIRFTLVLSALFFLSPGFEALAKTKTFVREYTYNASEADSKLSARAMALIQIKELLFEELGTYVRSTFTMGTVETESAFKEMSVSELASMCAGVTQTKILEETWNGEIYYLKAKISVEEDDLKRHLKEMEKNRNELDKMAMLKRKADSAMAEIEQLKKELRLAASMREKSRLEKLYLERTNRYTSSEWFRRNWIWEHEQVDQQQPKMEVVFVLDATGSMGGMIANAKDKIWSIASSLAQAEPAPQLSFGFVAFRDIRDAYVTKQVSLTSDIDQFYYKLMAIKAAGGGDTPESVNQALAEAVFDFQWDDDPGTYRSIFLVGDSPPHMNYNDVKYQKSCAAAVKKDIIINTIQCGSNVATARIWTEIADFTNGEHLKLTAAGSGYAVTTPYDLELKKLARELDQGRMYHGTEKQRRAGNAKKDVSDRIYKEANAEESAKRAIYNVTTKSGKGNFLGENELINDIMEGEVELEDVAEESLPASLQALPAENRGKVVQAKVKQRKKLENRIAELDLKRDEYLREQMAGDKTAVDSSFNSQIFHTLKRQTSKKKFRSANAPKF